MAALRTTGISFMETTIIFYAYAERISRPRCMQMRRVPRLQKPTVARNCRINRIRVQIQSSAIRRR